MSYYNDFALVLDKKAGELLDTKLITMNREVVDLFVEHPDHFQIDSKTNCRFYFWQDVKSTEEEFEFIRLFIYDLDEEHFRFIRLGESYGDIESEGELECVEFNLRVSAEIKFEKVSSQKDKENKS